LAGQPETAWPPEFAIVRTAAIFADDLREAVVACQRAGLSPAAVEEQGIRQGRAELVSLARFYQEYLDIIAFAQVVDYPELLLLACRQLADEATRQLVRPPGSLLIVDNLEDVDDLQGQLLDGLVDGLSPTIVTWDPDRGIDSFRGAGLRSQATLVERWMERDGLAITVAQDGFGVSGAVEEALADLRRRIPLPPAIATSLLDEYRQVTSDRLGTISKLVFADSILEADHIATALKEAHFVGGIPYQDMAILVRKRDQFPIYQLGCQQAGVPVTVSGDELRLGEETIVQVLLAGLRLVRDGLGASPLDQDLVAPSPLGRTGVIAAGQACLTERVGDVVWALWQASDWAEELVEALEGSTALRAHRELDAVIALLSLAQSFADLAADQGITALDAAVQAQQLPDDLPHGSQGSLPAVRLTTASRAKAQNWSLVVVAGVEDGVWPLPARRSPLIALEPAGFDERAVWANERRLFYTACASAHSRLIVTAVANGERAPSVFFESIRAEIRQVSPQVVAPPTTAPQLIGRLRQVAASETAHPGLRQAACDRLAQLAERPGYAQADPGQWWDLPAGEIVDESREVGVVDLAVSQIETLLQCPRQWFLSRRAAGERPVNLPAQIGSLIHRLAASGQDLAAMEGELAQAWGDLEFRADWQRQTELDQAKAALGRFAAYVRARGRTTEAVELSVDFTLDCGGPVRVQGRIDRLERDQDGRGWVVDFKTGRTAPTVAKGEADIQLGLYQLGLGQSVPLAGAELVFLRLPDGQGSALPKTFFQNSLRQVPYLSRDPGLGLAAKLADPQQYPTWVHHRVAVAAGVIRQGRYPCRASEGCRRCPFTVDCPAQGSES
jgi:hypothetical protein